MASRKVRRVVRLINEFVDRAVAALVLEIHNELVRSPADGGTPVDTGWASANWVPRVGGPPSPPPVLTSRIDRLRAAPAARAAAAQGVADVAVNYRVKLGPVFISNAVPYVIILERRRPFIQAAIDRAIDTTTRRFSR